VTVLLWIILLKIGFPGTLVRYFSRENGNLTDRKSFSKNRLYSDLHILDYIFRHNPFTSQNLIIFDALD
jgi:hypothetical protein